MSALDWVTLGANIFSSVGTVGAFGVGMVLLRQEHRREEIRLEEQRRNQAVMVSAWIDASRTPAGGRELFFNVHNASQMPIYEVSLQAPTPEDATGTTSHEAQFVALVPPGQTIRKPAPKEWLTSYFSPEPVEIEFLDSGGQRWARDEQGSLSATSSLP